MDRRGPRFVMEVGVAAHGGGPVAGDLRRASPGMSTPRWACWSARARTSPATPGRRCFCRTGSCAAAGWRISIAFAGVGFGSIVLLPWLQTFVERQRLACRLHGAGPAGARGRWCRSTCCCAGGPRRSACSRTATPTRPPAARGAPPVNIVDPAWAAIDWTLARAMRTGAVLVDRGRRTSRRCSPGTPCRCTRPSTSIETGFSAAGGGLGARRRQPGRRAGPDRARLAIGPDRPRMVWAIGSRGSASPMSRCSLLRVTPRMPLLYRW